MFVSTFYLKLGREPGDESKKCDRPLTIRRLSLDAIAITWFYLIGEGLFSHRLVAPKAQYLPV